MSKLFDPLASYVTMTSSAESTNYINGDFAPDHKGDYRKGIAVTSEEITGDLSDDNLPFALRTEFKKETKASDTNKDAASAKTDDSSDSNK